MSVAKKGKRKIQFNDMIFYWYVADWAKEEYPLHIMSEDKKIQIHYQVNSINQHIICPKVFIEKSDTWKRGTYSFFPVLSDEGISAYNVRKILEWYFNGKTKHLLS